MAFQQNGYGVHKPSQHSLSFPTERRLGAFTKIGSILDIVSWTWRSETISLSSNERVDIPIFLCSSALTKIKPRTHYIFFGFHSFVRVGTQHKYKIWNKVQNLIHFFNEKWNACVSPSKRVIFISELVQKVPFNAFFSIMHSNRHEPLLVFTLHQLHCWDFKFCLWTKLTLGWSLSYFNTIFVFFL